MENMDAFLKSFHEIGEGGGLVPDWFPKLFFYSFPKHVILQFNLKTVLLETWDPVRKCIQ